MKIFELLVLQMHFDTNNLNNGIIILQINIMEISNSIAPVAVEILLCRGSAQKIVTDDGKKLQIKILLLIFAVN